MVVSDLLPPVVVSDLLPPLAAMLTVFIVIWAVYALFAGNRNPLNERIGKYGKGRMTAKQVERNSPLFKDRSFSTIGVLDRALSHGSYADRVALDLARAAIPLRVGEYLLIRWVGAVILFVLGYSLGGSVPIAIALGLLGFFMPRWYVGRKEAARVRRIEDQLVDALTMMSNAIKSGSSFLQAMEMVSRELPPPVAEEFAQVVAEVGVGAPLEQALDDLRRRVRSYDVYLIVTAMTVQRTVGGNLAEVLQNIAHTIRERQRLLRQVQVETAEERFSAYILMALPTLLLFAMAGLNRGYLDVMLAEGPGRLMLAGALVFQLVGYLIMRRIADIRV